MQQKVYALFTVSLIHKDYAGFGYPEDLIAIHKSYDGMEKHLKNFIHRHSNYTLTEQDIAYFRRYKRTKLSCKLNMLCMVYYLLD
ncbi:MAG: hypothetical protein NC038_05400 [Paludibacter sp.]|nr:hypothetical protein [Bacteroidales bacterium]MCM1069806.1 hypothetical protein [Prevotella sp.]MCM1354000.1 hypothetical protein [Bacteroides sp.]MCM1443358.1 hypothetical protein [Muribaculum sp.]MCM1482061.1 hypothetical protein [Paludibacter sp.]